MTLPGRLFPHFVCRIAGLPVNALEALRVEASAALGREIDRLERDMAERREGLTDGLFTAVSATNDRRERGAILQVKRDVHNLRRVRPGQLRKLRDLVPAALFDDLDGYRVLGEDRRLRREELEREFPRELNKVRRRFRKALRDSDFQKGLLLSSRSLHKAVDRYARTPVDRMGSKERQIERGLMRYFSRTAMKATPFGTLCAIAAGELVDDGPENLAFEGDPRVKHSRIRLNKSLYGNLLNHLLRQPTIRRDFHIELNPTLATEDGRWAFLANVNGKEVFQRLKPNPVVELVRETFTAEPHLPLRTVAERVGSRPEIEAAEDEIEAYLIRLLEIGFLRFRIGIREQEVNWDQPFRAILEAINDEDAQELAAFLERLRDHSEAYADAGPEQRPELLAAASELTRAAFAKIDAKIGPLANLPFYEDAGSAASLHLSRSEMETVTEPLIEYIQLTSRLAWPRSEQATARHVFDTLYSSSGDTANDTANGAVPLLRFYEDFYREHFKGHLKQQQGQRPIVKDDTPEKEEYDLQNPFGLELTARIKTASEALTRKMQELWRADPKAEEIQLERADFESIVGEIPAPDIPCRSVSAFVQYLPGFGPTGRGGLVANIYHNGFGKYFSRFLYLLPEKVQKRLFANNEQLTDHYVAEICGDGAFNGNLHPPLMPWELSYPTGESGPSKAQLRTSEIGVARDPDDPDALCLVHLPTGKRVLPVDLGFLNSQMRPPLYQLLARFTPPASFIPMIPESPDPPPQEDTKVETAGEPNPEQSGNRIVSPDTVFYRPRITYRGSIVLGRRLWIVPATAFPRPQGDETAAGYFARVERWRRSHGIPSEVFLQVRPLQPYVPEPKGQGDLAEKVPGTEDEGEEGAKTAPRETAEKVPGTAEKVPDTGDEPTGDDPKTHHPPAQAQGPALRGDLYKPQYIDFHNPLLLDLFSKANGPLENFLLVLAERLPAREHLPSGGNDEAFATEFVFQIDFPAGPGGSTP